MKLLESLVPLPVGNASMLVPGTDRDHLFTVYSAGHWYEDDLLAAIKALQRGGVFVDIGAGYGNHTVFFAVECCADRVIAVEPYPGNFEILEANIRHNNLVDAAEATNALVHPSWSSAKMNAAPGQALPETWAWSSQPVLTEHGDVRCLTVDQLLAGVHVDVIKIDIEEMSIWALTSGSEMLRRCRPLISIEAEPPDERAINDLLTALDYRCLGRYCATPTFLWQAT